MQVRSRVLIVLALTGFVVTAGCASMAFSFNKKSDDLWKIVNEQCVPNQREHNDPAPCRLVDLRNGFVVLKDRNGPLQYLLLPVEKISGIESPELLNPATPNFVAEAWRSRHYMEQIHGQKINDAAFALSVNSLRGRTQNQLHVHISCLRPDIRQQLNALDKSLTAVWQTHQLGEHVYQMRAATRDEIKRMSPFLRVANEIPGAREEMHKYGIAVASLSNGRRVLMVIKRNLLMMNNASAEELQDHSCAIIKTLPAAPSGAALHEIRSGILLPREQADRPYISPSQSTPRKTA